MDDLFLGLFLQAHEEAPKLIVIDLDTTNDPSHGKQEGRFFHGYYGGYCYLPLYFFCVCAFFALRQLADNNLPAARSMK